MRAPGFGGSLERPLNDLEELVVDPKAPRSSNLNRGGGGGGGSLGGDIGMIYSNLRQSDVSERKRKASSCGHCRDHHPDDPCGAASSKKCTKPCRNTCGA